MRSSQPRKSPDSPSSALNVVSAEMSSSGAKRYGIKALLLVAVLGSALGVRAWHDRQRVSSPPVSLNAGALEQRARQAPDDLETQIAWGNALSQQGRNPEAMTVFAQCASLNPHDPRAYSGLASLAMQEERWDIARVNLREALKYSPADADLWRTLGGLYMRAKKWGPALDAYTHTTQLRPDDALAWRQRGVLEMKAGIAGEGHDALARAVALNPQDLDVQYALGLSALRTGQLAEARKVFEQVLARRPDDAQAQVQLVNVDIQLDPSPAGLAEAQKRLRSLLNTDTTGAAHLAQGRIYLLQRKYAPAINEFRASLAEDKTEPTAYVYLSQAYAATGQQELARKAGSEYQKLTAQTKAAPAPTTPQQQAPQQTPQEIKQEKQP